MARRALCNHIWLLLLLPALFSVARAGSDQPQPHPAMEQVLERCRQQLLREEPLSTSAVASLVRKQQPDGTWPDLNYADDSMSQWEPKSHLERLAGLAQAYATPGHASHGAPRLRAAVQLGLDHWLEKRYQCHNWWHNQIGVPQHMRDIVVLLGREIGGGRREKALGVIGQHQLRGTGANLVWSAELAFHLACLTRDTARADAAAGRLWKEVSVGRPEGIQPDWSFYQHGPRLQSFHYGSAFFDVAGKIAWQLRGTPWEIPETQREHLSNYLLEGQQWMCRGIYTVPGTMDRKVSRKGSLADADLRSLLELWKDVHPGREAEITTFLDRQSSSSAPQLSGFRAFPYGDFFAYQRPEFSFFLKTISSRTQPTESINSENLKGVPYLHSGDHYLLRTGEEYSNLQPLWEWDKLPGLTTAPGLEKQERLPFTGGLGNGRSGVAAMDYRRAASSESSVSLHARKLWSFHDDMVICLIAEVETTGVTAGISTSLEQSRLAGPVMWKPHGTPASETIAEGTQRTQEAAWVLHNGTGYVPFPAPARLAVDTRTRTGSWKTINAGYDDKPVNAPVFALQIEHNAGLGAGGYAVVGEATEQSLEAIAGRPPWNIIRNDSRCQSLKFADGLQAAAFYEPLKAAEAPGLGVDAPCLAMWKGENLWICDPTHKGRTISVTRRNQAVSLTLPPHGAAVRHVWDTPD